MFTLFDLAIGAVGIRISRKYKKIRNIPDMVYVKKNLAFGGVTSYRELVKLKIDSVIDLRAETPIENIENNLIDYNKIGFLDGDVPTFSQIDMIHKIINEREKQGKTVFVHCNLGRGRATLMTMSYLLKQDLDWDTDLKKIRKRRFVYLNKKQWNFLEKLSNGNLV